MSVIKLLILLSLISFSLVRREGSCVDLCCFWIARSFFLPILRIFLQQLYKSHLWCWSLLLRVLLHHRHQCFFLLKARWAQTSYPRFVLLQCSRFDSVALGKLDLWTLRGRVAELSSLSYLIWSRLTWCLKVEVRGLLKALSRAFWPLLA